MKLGLLTVMFGDTPLKEVLAKVKHLDLDTVELATGNYPGGAHAPVDELLESKDKRDELMKMLEGEGLEISALSCHGNCLHPTQGKEFAEVQTKTIRLAAEMGIGVVNDFSGCPGTDPDSKRPSWVTCPWPPDFLETLEWQWNEVAIPYWTKQAQFAKEHNVKIAFEAHPGFLCYNTETLLKLRNACGDQLGVNFDPSHFFWQGMDPIAMIEELGDSIYHVHAKDSRTYPKNVRLNGVNDTKHYGEIADRSWLFRTCGYGHSFEFWTEFFSALRLAGYDGPVSIEHEDSLMSNMEGLTKAVEFLRQAIIREQPTEMTWA